MRKTVLLFIFLLATAGAVNALNPKRTYDISPSEFGMDYEEVSFETDDGLSLFGWYFKAQGMSGRAIIISHNGEGNMENMIEIAGSFISLGFNVLTYDYRGFGKSDDFNINPSFFIYAQFEKDLNAAVNYIMTKRSANVNVMLYGQGIGAGLSVAAAGEHRRVSRVIADSPYTSLLDIQERIREATGNEPMIPLAYNKNLIDPLSALESRNAQTKYYLFIAGDKDKIFRSRDIRGLHRMVRNNSAFYVAKGATASNTFSSNKRAYFEEIRKFVE